MAAAATSSYTATQSEARSGAQQYLTSRLANGNSTTNQTSSNFTIPEIDISPSFSSSLEDRKKVASQIHSACTNSGFFHITNHGVSPQTRKSIISLAKRFFQDLPLEKKQALHVKNSPYFRGWEPSDYTYVNPDDWTSTSSAPETKQGFNWAYEEGLDSTGGDGQYLELDGKCKNGNIWPSEDDLPGFYATIQEYYSSVLNLARHLFRLFALSLDLEEDYFDHMTTHPGGIARLLYYPPSDLPADKEVGLGAHSDYECFTILLCDPTSGLEILSPENEWIRAPHVEGSFVINVADFLMRWTNGVYKSTVHRVVNRGSEERYSVPFFFSINYDLLVETLPSCVSDDNPPKYGPVKAGEYILERLRATAKDG